MVCDDFRDQGRKLTSRRVQWFQRILWRAKRSSPLDENGALDSVSPARKRLPKEMYRKRLSQEARRPKRGSAEDGGRGCAAADGVVVAEAAPERQVYDMLAFISPSAFDLGMRGMADGLSGRPVLCVACALVEKVVHDHCLRNGLANEATSRRTKRGR